MSDTFKKLAAKFPRNAVSWRAQTVTKDGSKALALAYIDSRDVQDRLDEVVGPENWQDRYEVHGAKTICYLSLRIDGEWVTKGFGRAASLRTSYVAEVTDYTAFARYVWQHHKVELCNFLDDLARQIVARGNHKIDGVTVREERKVA